MKSFIFFPLFLLNIKRGTQKLIKTIHHRWFPYHCSTLIPGVLLMITFTSVKIIPIFFQVQLNLPRLSLALVSFIQRCKFALLLFRNCWESFIHPFLEKGVSFPCHWWWHHHQGLIVIKLWPMKCEHFMFSHFLQGLSEPVHSSWCSHLFLRPWKPMLKRSFLESGPEWLPWREPCVDQQLTSDMSTRYTSLSPAMEFSHCWLLPHNLGYADE